MPIEAREIPKIIFWFVVMGLSAYLMTYLSSKIREQVTAAVES